MPSDRTRRTRADDHGKLLVNDLTIGDARHLLKVEGGPLDASQIVVRAISIAVVATACAYAIWAGQATVWHLALPMVGEYLVLIFALPIVYLVVRDPAMWKDTIGALRLLALLTVANIAGIALRSYQTGVPWREQIPLDLQLAWRWIVDHKMHWAILAAVASVLLGLPRCVANLKQYGPPFYPVGLGCGMRVAVLFLACFLLPIVASGTALRNAWILWGLLLAAEVLALGMHIDIQRRLAKIDGNSDD